MKVSLVMKDIRFKEQRELTQNLHFYGLGPIRGDIWCCRLKHQLCLAPDISSIVVPVCNKTDDR